jgi:serine/threonine protein kinase
MNQTLPASHNFVALADAVATSGLAPEDELLAVVAAANGDVQTLAQMLAARFALTSFQIAALSEGRGASLRVGNYDLLDRLGAGGMGTVFKARHRRMKRVVALKVLATNLSSNPVFVKRFQREVETIASLGHPNVVMAYDADEAEAGHFLVMEFVNGRDLAACIEREGAFSLSRAVNCILQAARGLAYAHSQDIIHRDIKPHNLLLDESGVVKVTDLGLARLNHGADGPATGADVTMAGGVIGTADYMPPEQAIDSTTIDHRADIYSLGCTLHYLLTGRPPYAGPTIVSILLKHRDAPIPQLSQERTDVPPRLDDLLRRMLAKDPQERIQRMAEVVAELEAIASTLGPEQTTAHSPQLSLGSTIELAPGTIDSPAATTSHLPDQTLVMDPSTTPLTVLIVEPSRVQASIIKGYLQEQSLLVAGTATTGEAAIDAVRRLRPRAVISAMHLADTSGLVLAEQIRSEFASAAPGFVLVTSEGDSASQGNLHRVLILPKPFTPKQLGDALSQVTGASTQLSAGITGSSPKGASGTGRDRSRLRVLIVDDSATARINVRNVLQGLGFAEFLEVPDGAHAIAVAAREICDLIVTDYNMPLMDGRALVSYLKQNPATAAIPIVMVTTETEPHVLDPVRRLGVVAVVEKAFPASVVGPLLDSLF